MAGATIRAVRHAKATVCWRPSGAARWGTLAAFGGISVLAVFDELQNGHSGLGGLQVAVALFLLWFLFAWRPSLCVRCDEVVIRNPLWTRRIPLSAVQDAAPGYLGIVIRRTDRRLPVTAWAIQQMNITATVGAETRAGRAAEQIRAAAATSSSGVDE